MTRFYIGMIGLRRITLEQVPAYWRAQVEAAMAA